MSNFAALTREAELEELAMQLTDEEGGGEVVEDSETDEEQDDAYDLPAGWHAILDESTGRTYFANLETGESSWEPPAG